MLRSCRGLALALLPILVMAASCAGCSSSSEEVAATSSGSLSASRDLASQRDFQSTLDTTTVAHLEQAWSRTQDAEAEGAFYVASPVVDRGVVYLQDPDSDVEAIDLESGDLLWERHFAAPTVGPNGVTVADGTVFAATPTAAFGLEAKTGKTLWSTKLSRNSSEKIAMTPGYHEGRVYFSTAPGALQGGEVGVLWALDSKSGKKLWHFDTVPRGLWGHPGINFGGGLSYAPSFDGEGSMFVGISHAGPIPGTKKYPWGSSRPGPNLYADSIVKLDEKTGKVEWHYQIDPHNLCSGFLVSPVLARMGGRRVVLDAGYSGVVVALDQETGKLLWRKPVGTHNGHDRDGLLAMRGEYADLTTPMTVYPGLFGGVSGSLSAGSSTILVPVMNGAAKLLSQTRVEQVGAATGELVALDVGTGEIRWKHSFPASVRGPTAITNDLGFVTSLDGVITAFDLSTGEKVWSQAAPSSVEGGTMIAGDFLLVRTGYPLAGEAPGLVAYRLPQ